MSAWETYKTLGPLLFVLSLNYIINICASQTVMITILKMNDDYEVHQPGFRNQRAAVSINSTFMVQSCFMVQQFFVDKNVCKILEYTAKKYLLEKIM